jgi:hypothetical protein
MLRKMIQIGSSQFAGMQHRCGGMMRAVQLAVVCGVILVAAAGQVQAGVINTELISNGGFETGNFSSWNRTNSGSGDWFINNGSTNWPTSGVRSPISGNFDAVTSQSGPGFHDLWQSFVLPNDITTATLSWDDRIFSGAGFSDPNQEFRVLLKSATGTPLLTVFSTNPGDLNPQVGPNNRSFDLTAFATANAGGTFRLSFEEQDNLWFFNVFVDNVSFKTTFVEPAVVPEPATLAVFGIGACFAGFGAARRRRSEKLQAAAA